MVRRSAPSLAEAHPMRRRLRTLLQSVRRRAKPSPDGRAEIVVTPVEARQGFLGKPVLLVLTVSIVLAVASIAIILMSEA
jgi:hypothetical protein